MYSSTIDIAATPTRVFEVLTDNALLKQWSPEVIESRPPDGGLRVGAKATALVEEFGRRFPVDLLVAAFEPGARLAYDMTTPMWSGRVEYLLTRGPRGTTLSFSMNPDRPKGWKLVPAVVLAPLMRGVIMRKLRSRLDALRQVVEANL